MCGKNAINTANSDAEAILRHFPILMPNEMCVIQATVDDGR